METSSAPEKRAGRPVDIGKRVAVMQAAQKLFTSNGFAGTSMDAIAEAAGVSKLTAYKYFGNKQQLFAEAVAAKCESVMGQLEIDHAAGHDLRDCLLSFGRGFLSLILNPEAVAVQHLVITERDRVPELGMIFFESAVRPISDKLAVMIARYEEAGNIATGDDPLAAAQDLLALWRGRPFMMMELGSGEIDADGLAAHVTHCVDLCLKAWTPR